jgi:hypothetical protein
VLIRIPSGKTPVVNPSFFCRFSVFFPSLRAQDKGVVNHDPRIAHWQVAPRPSP